MDIDEILTAVEKRREIIHEEILKATLKGSPFEDSPEAAEKRRNNDDWGDPDASCTWCSGCEQLFYVHNLCWVVEDKTQPANEGNLKQVCQDCSDVIPKPKHYGRGRRIEKTNVKELFERQEGKCPLCGEPLLMHLKHPHPLSPSVDHKKPLSAGGEDTMENKQLVHLKCNHVKNSSE